MLGTDKLYQLLHQNMGPQGWWPANNEIEMMLGAILVQNTNWRNAALALKSLKETTGFNPHSILNIELETLQEVIRSSGFYKNKAKGIHALFAWLEQHAFQYENMSEQYDEELRSELLQIRGIGPETADVLLVYIFKRVEFIPDSYTRRIYNKLGYEHTDSYEKFKKQISLPHYFTNQDANEFHALLDNFGKSYFNHQGNEQYTFLDPYFKK